MIDLTKPDEVKSVILWAATAEISLKELLAEGWVVLDIKNMPNTDDDKTFMNTIYTLGKFHGNR